MNHKNESASISAKMLKIIGNTHDLDHRSIKSEGNGWGTELDGAVNSEVELIDPNSSGSLEKAVFKIPHILESIFANLDKQALLNCRLVSFSWASCASQQLRKIVQILFLSNDRPGKPKAYHLSSNPDRSFEDFTALMENSSHLPFSKFSFFGQCYLNPSTYYKVINSLFETHAPVITQLHLDAQVLFSDLWLLLSSQAPNLQQLRICDVPDYKCDHFEDQNERLESVFRECSNFDEQCERIKSILDETSFEFRPTFKHLKVFQCGLEMPDAGLLQILNCAPNLIEVYVAAENLHVLLKPTNRLHLVKEINILDCKLHCDNSLEQVASHHQNQLLLRKFGFGVFVDMDTNDEADEYSYSVGATIMREILSSSAATLEEIEWQGVVGGFVALKMPQVHCLTIKYFEPDLWDLSYAHARIGVSLGQTYPNLKSLIVEPASNTPDELENILIRDYFRDQIPVLSVTKISINLPSTESMLRQFREMFPVADIVVEGA